MFDSNQEHSVSNIFGLPQDPRTFSKSERLPYGIKTGVEVEVEGIDYHMFLDSPYWSKECDHSLKHKGVEFKTNLPMLGKDLENAIKNLFDWLDNYDSIYLSHRESVHVHLDVSQLKVDEILKVVVGFALTDSYLMDFVEKNTGISRRYNIFCLPFTQAEKAVDVISAIKYGSADGLKKAVYDSFKYNAVNISSMNKFGTIELRHAPFVKDRNFLFDWINTVHKVYSNSLDYNSAADIVKESPAEGITKLLGIPYQENYNKLYLDSWLVAKDILNFKLMKDANILQMRPKSSNFGKALMVFNSNEKETA